MQQPLRRELRPDALPDSIERFYEAAANPTLWRATLQQFSEATGAEGSLMMFHGEGSRPRHVCSEGLDGSIDAFFAARWHDRNEAIRRGRVLAQRGVEVQSEWQLFDAEEYRRDPFHQEFLRPNGFAWFAGVFVARSATSMLSLSPQRRSRDEPFAMSELAAIERMLPHLRRAGTMALMFGETRATNALDMLASLDVPAFLLDRAGRVCRLNPLASEVLGAGIDLVRGRPTTADPAAELALHRLIHALTAPDPAQRAAPPGPVPLPRADGRPLIASGMPLVGSAHDVFSAGVALLTVTDPDRSRVDADLLLQRACGLTRAEAATARALADGLDLAEVATMRRVGLETIRSQAKSVGIKTGARNRGKLVSVLNRILATVPKP